MKINELGSDNLNLHKVYSKSLPKKKIYIGNFRAQMDFQQLPAIEGNAGFEYKFSIIHPSTRWKYSEIHSEATTKVPPNLIS